MYTAYRSIFENSTFHTFCTYSIFTYTIFIKTESYVFDKVFCKKGHNQV